MVLSMHIVPSQRMSSVSHKLHINCYLQAEPSETPIHQLNLEKDNTGKETSSANPTSSTITKQTSLCAAALQGVAHPSDGSPELLDDHDLLGVPASSVHCRATVGVGRVAAVGDDAGCLVGLVGLVLPVDCADLLHE